MPRIIKTITFSLAPEMVEWEDEFARRRGWGRSEFLLEVVLCYVEGCE